MTGLGFVSKSILASRRRNSTSVRRPTRSRLELEPLEERALLSANVLQTNLVSDLPGVAEVTDPNLVNPWGIAQGNGGPFWISDNNAGLATLYNVPGANNTPVAINPLVVNIPTPVSLTGGAPDGAVRNNVGGSTFQITGPNQAGQTTSASAVFLFATEDGTIIGWNPGIDPTGKFAGPGGASTQAVIAVDNSGNNFTNPNPNQQTGAVYKGLSIATSDSPIFASDPNSTSVLYAANFRSGQVEVYDSNFQRVDLPADGFADPNLPAGYAPFNVQVLDDKVYVTYAQQDAAKHDDVGGQGHGFIDVFNLDGTPGLPGGLERLVSRGPLDSPWGLALAPSSFGNVANDLLVGNFKSGFIDIFNPATGQFLGKLKDPDGEPIQIDRLWTLRVGGGGAGGDPNSVYFTAGIDNEMHGLFGSLTAVAPGTPEGPAEAQKVVAALDVFQLDLQQLLKDISSGAAQATIAQDQQTLQTDFGTLVRAEQQFAQDSSDDQARADMPAVNPTALRTSAAPGTPERSADAQAMAAALDAVQHDLATLIADINSGASPSTIAQDTQTEETDSGTLVLNNETDGVLGAVTANSVSTATGSSVAQVDAASGSSSTVLVPLSPSDIGNALGSVKQQGRDAHFDAAIEALRNG